MYDLRHVEQVFLAMAMEINALCWGLNVCQPR